MKIADYLLAYPDDKWTMAKQLGVKYAVARMPDADKEIPWKFETLKNLKSRFNDSGFEVKVIEPSPIDYKIKLGLPGRDEEIERYREFLGNMGKLEIPVLCQNFMAKIGWFRSSGSIPTRGGALVTGFNYDDVKDDPYTEEGFVTQEKMWDNLEYFLKAVVPAAEEAGVKIALHPDDPPIPYLRGIGRILISKENFLRAVNIVKSPNIGITMCQGCFATMGEDVIQTIHEFTELKKLFYVHFRDVEGTPEHFEERFHDDGKTDMAAAVRAYLEAGFDGYARVDHVPTMHGEQNGKPGYEALGRLYAIGYMRGLIEGISKEMGLPYEK